MHCTGEPKGSLAGQKEPSTEQQMTADNRGWPCLHFSGSGVRVGLAERRHHLLPGSQPLKQGQGLIKTQQGRINLIAWLERTVVCGFLAVLV